MKVLEYGNELIVLQYDFLTDTATGAYRHLNSPERIQLQHWYGNFAEKSLPSWLLRSSNSYEDLRYRLTEVAVDKAYWKSLNHARHFVRRIIEKYILKGYTLPEMQVQVLNIPTQKSGVDKLSMMSDQKSEHEKMKEEIERDLKAMMISCGRKKFLEVLISGEEALVRIGRYYQMIHQDVKGHLQETVTLVIDLAYLQNWEEAIEALRKLENVGKEWK